MKLRLLPILLLLAFGLSASQAEDAEDMERHALLFTIEGAIGPAAVDYLKRGFSQAQDRGAPLIIIQMDTPGGLDTAMRDIIRAIIASPIPVATYVAPGGSRAASAGTYILYASHVAAMAPGTNLGAATPVQIGGAPGVEDFNDDDDDNADDEKAEEENDEEPDRRPAMERKLIEDAVAYIRALADMRGRNADWAEKAVRESVSLGATEALELNVIDHVAENVDDLLAQIHGREVKVAVGTVTLDTKDLIVTRVDPDWRNELLAIITNPNIAYILMLVGIYGLIFELANPGSIVPGVLGAICILVALFAFQALPINYAGAALMLLGVAFMVAEAFMPSFGILGIGGLVAFALGSLLLVDTGVEAYEISMTLVIGVSIVSFAVFFGIASMALRAYRMRVTAGREQLLGIEAVAAADFVDGRGKVRVLGELWNAESEEAIRKGDSVKVTAVDGLHLQVSRAGAEESSS